MRFRVHHTTKYRYSNPVQLGGHIFRFRPRCDAALTLGEFRLRVHPRPAVWTECLDLDGNSVVQAHFDGATDALTVVSHFSADTLRENPFDFVLEPWATRLPFQSGPEIARFLEPYRCRESPSAEVDQFTRAVLNESNGETVTFLTSLCRRISERCRPILRLDGDAWEPGTTLREGAGACRDLAVLFNDACRSVGLSTRFVSGYQEVRQAEDDRYLHAWSEVYLPGAGWRGFDPTTGLAVADRHIPVAAAAHPANAAPADGKFRSPGAIAELVVEIKVDTGTDETRAA